MIEIRILKLDLCNGRSHAVRDYVAQESPLHVFVNRTFYTTIMCSPSNLEELAIGHLVTEGIVKSLDELEDIIVEKNACRVRLVSNVNLEKRLKLSIHLKRAIFSACGVQGVYEPSRRLTKIKSKLPVRAETVSSCVKQLNTAATIFKKTGGVHAAAIFRKDGAALAFSEDVGRHNAVDKTVGMAVRSKIDLGECFLALTGRLTAEIVVKTARVGLPIVASIAAALDSGIAIAKQVDLTLVGFVRGTHMNVYTCPERIIF